MLQRHQTEQILLNTRLMEELSELQQEAQLIHEIPQRLCESVENCKEIYKDVLSIFQVKHVHYVCLWNNFNEIIYSSILQNNL